MPRTRLTDALVAKIPVSTGRVFHWDTEVPRLALLVYPSGQKSWIAQWHQDGRDIRVALGHPPVMDVRAARRKAVEAIAGVSAAPLPARRQEPARTFQDASTDYLKERLEGRVSERKARDLLGRVAPLWFRALPLSEVTMDALRRAHQERAEIPGLANNMVQAIRTVINFAVEKRWLQASPLVGRMDLYPKQRRKKALTVAQYKALMARIRERFEADDRIQWLALEAIVLTGGRKTEILTLRADEVDRDRMVITKTEHKTARKTGAKEIPITQQFLDVLARVDAWKQRRIAQADREPVIAQRMAESPYVFPAPGRRDSAQGYLFNVDDDARDLFRAMADEGVFPDGFVIHNLRSAFVSIAMNQGIDVSVVAKLVGHADVQTTLRHYREVNEDEVNSARTAMTGFFDTL